MFTNILLLSLLTITYGINAEDENTNTRDQNAFNFLNVPAQHEDLKFFKTPRAIRTPFRNTEIMTARGFGKRAGEIEEYGSDNGIENADDYMAVRDNSRQQKLLFPYIQELLKLPPMENEISSAPIRNHRLQIRDGTLKFRLNDGGLRIGRGFGKRSYFADIEPVDYRNEINSDEMEKTPWKQNQKGN